MRISKILLVGLLIVMFGCIKTSTDYVFQKDGNIIEVPSGKNEKEKQKIREKQIYIAPKDSFKSSFGEYSYQGYIDPQTITRNWIVLDKYIILVGPSAFELYYKNPKSPCKIPVAVFLVYKGMPMGFSYLYGGDVYLYLFDEGTKCYKGKKLEGKAKDSFKKKFNKVLEIRDI